VTVISFVLFFIGVAVSGVDSNLGAGIGGPGLLLFPVGLILLAIAGVNRLLARNRIRRAARATSKLMQ
jgi:hypothetical protein